VSEIASEREKERERERERKQASERERKRDSVCNKKSVGETGVFGPDISQRNPKKIEYKYHIPNPLWNTLREIERMKEREREI